MKGMSNILLIFGIAGLAVPLLQRIRFSATLAYLLLGIVIGPYGLTAFFNNTGWVTFISINDEKSIHFLAELGIVSLMFMMGLGLSLDKLRELKHYIFGLGSMQIIVTAIVIGVIARLYYNAPGASILLGASLALSSTAIVMKYLEERRLINQPVGILCFSILLMQDLAVVPILVLAASLSPNGETAIFTSLIKALLIGSLTIIAMMVIGKRLLKPLLRSVSISSNPEWLSAFTIFIVIAFAMLTYNAGLSFALGAFLAGLLIAETEFRHEVEIIVGPLKGLLLGIFFLSIGMMIDIFEVLRHPILILLSVLGIYLIKATILFPLCLLFKIPEKQAAQTAIYLAQPGEFALLILGVALSTHVIPSQDVQFFLLVTVFAMMLTPFLFNLIPITTKFINYFMKQGILNLEYEKVATAQVIIAGFGHVGQMVAEALEEQNIMYIAFDHNADHVQKLKKVGDNLIFGDARKIQLWRRLHSTQLKAVIITIDNSKVTEHILKMIHVQWPELTIIVRSREIKDIQQLYNFGAKQVVAESLESSLRIIAILMKEMDVDAVVAEKLLEKLRAQHFLESY